MMHGQTQIKLILTKFIGGLQAIPRLIQEQKSLEKFYIYHYA